MNRVERELRRRERRRLEEINKQSFIDGFYVEAIRITIAAIAVLITIIVLILAVSWTVEAQAGTWESAGTWKLTAYCPESCCNGENAHRTASGAPMVVGRTVAVGHLPFGTRIMIDGHVYVVEDRGVRGKHVDILHPSHEAALEFGRQYKEVFIWKED